MPPKSLTDTFDMFTPRTPRGPVAQSVTQINQRAKQLLERQLGRVVVIGEVSNLKWASGHLWFSLKDGTSQLNAVLFRREAQALKFELRDGMEVVVTGRLTVYSAYGRYQLVGDQIEPRGQGALQAAFEQLKEKLEREGLFASSRKRPLPLVPERVAVVTSPTGAVIRDIIHVSRRRFPDSDIVVVPSRVQGPDSARDIAQAIEHLGAHHEELGVDVLIVARGGGSLEDLWGFNDERVARAIVASPIPVVSAVGHETDYTIADFVADRRAPTPSAAAEIVFPIKSELRSVLVRHLERSTVSLRRQLQRERQRLAYERMRLGDGRSLVAEYAQRLTYAQARLAPAFRRGVSDRRIHLGGLERRLSRQDPKVRLAELRGRLDQSLSRLRGPVQTKLGLSRARLQAAHERLELSSRSHVTQCRAELAAVARQLHALSPLQTLDRGYAIAIDEAGVAVREAEALEPGQRLRLKLHRGERQVIVE
ncbi:MAG: exodeoxyribonuclease VII large subunit [Myxococcota bacterium]|nr:exodeoxyribonuclease VII large subunit [Myxococcota bacterium]